MLREELMSLVATVDALCARLDRAETGLRVLNGADTTSRQLRHALADRIARIERLVTLQHREHYDADGVGDVAPEDESREMTALLAMIGGEG